VLCKQKREDKPLCHLLDFQLKSATRGRVTESKILQALVRGRYVILEGKPEVL
jgi:hypothetical protein